MKFARMVTIKWDSVDEALFKMFDSRNAFGLKGKKNETAENQTI